MFLKKYIPILVLAFLLIPCAANGGSLENMTNALENLADMSRSADRANEALHDALNGRPSRYYYRDYDDDDDWRPRRHHHKRKRHHGHKWHKHWPPPGHMWH